MRTISTLATAVAGALILATGAHAQNFPRQSAPQQLPAGRAVTAPVIPQVNVPPLSLPQRTTVARQLTGSASVTAGQTQRYGGVTPVPSGGQVTLYDATIAFVDGMAMLRSSQGGSTPGRVEIRVAQSPGLVMFECPSYQGAGLNWSTRVGNTVFQGTAPVVDQRVMFVVDLGGVPDKTVSLSASPSGQGFNFYYCDVTSLSG